MVLNRDQEGDPYRTGFTIALLIQSLDLLQRRCSEERNADLRSLQRYPKPKISRSELGFAALYPTYGLYLFSRLIVRTSASSRGPDTKGASFRTSLEVGETLPV